MIGVKVSRVSGTTVNGNGVKIAAEHTSADLLEDIEIDNVCVYADYQVHLGRTAANGCIVNHLRARNIQENSISTASLLYGSDANCAVRDGEVDISINRASYGNGGAQYHTQFAGTDAYRRFKVSGNVIGGSTGRGVQIQAAQTGNLISSITQRTGDQMIGGNAVSGTITLDGCDTSISNVISVSGVSGTVNINLQGNRFNNASGGVVRATSGTYNIRSAGDNDFQGTSVPAVAPSGTPTFNFYGWDLAIDPIAQGGIGATTGQFCTSTQATTEGGPAVLTPAGWVALGTGAAGINTVIT
jgi:hypothetical protein